jgi:hypothetical protein
MRGFAHRGCSIHTIERWIPHVLVKLALHDGRSVGTPNFHMQVVLVSVMRWHVLERSMHAPHSRSPQYRSDKASLVLVLPYVLPKTSLEIFLSRECPPYCNNYRRRLNEPLYSVGKGNLASLFLVERILIYSSVEYLFIYIVRRLLLVRSRNIILALSYDGIDLYDMLATGTQC